MIPTIPPPPSGQVSVQLIHDARAVHDTGSLKFQEFRANQQSAWIVATVEPQPESGSASVPGAYINADTGEFVSPTGAQLVVSKSGNWRTLANAPGAGQPTKATYSWVEPLTERRGALTAEDYYSPFLDGGTIVFRYDPSAAGIAQFDSVRLIFPDWAKDVASASVFFGSHPGLLENGEQRAPGLAQLRQLLADKNRFLVVEAFRELADGGHLDADVAFEHLTHADAPLDAILSYLMLTCRGDEIAERVNAVIYASRDEKKLQSIALGAFSALLFRSQDRKSLAQSKNALQHIRARALELKIPLDSSSYLNLILSKAGVL